MSEQAAAAPAADPAPAPAAAAPAAAPATQTWIDKITDTGIREFATNKGYNKAATPEEALAQSLRSYQGLEKLVGAEKAGRTVELPNWDATDEAGIAAKNAFLDRIGRPKTADDYAPTLKTGGVADTDFVSAMSGVMHKAGIPLNMATELTKGYQELQTSRENAVKIDQQTKYAAEQTTLKTEWGAKYDDNMKIAANAAKALGVKPEALETLQKNIGYGDVMRMFQGIAVKIGEGQFIDGDKTGSGGALSPAEAKSAWNTLSADPDFRKAMNEKSHPKRQEYMARKTQLSAWMAGQTA